jgi:hypothetical protein
MQVIGSRQGITRRVSITGNNSSLTSWLGETILEIIEASQILLKHIYRAQSKNTVQKSTILNVLKWRSCNLAFRRDPASVKGSPNIADI